MNGSRGMMSLAREGCIFQVPNLSRKTEVPQYRHPERSAAESKDPGEELKVMQRDSSTSLGMTANL
jgi:hypothetical protein